MYTRYAASLKTPQFGGEWLARTGNFQVLVSSTAADPPAMRHTVPLTVPSMNPRVHAVPGMRGSKYTNLLRIVVVGT